MSYELDRLFPDTNPPRTMQASALRERIDRLVGGEAARYARLWSYYHNPMRAATRDGENGSDRPYREAQEWGLPTRITGDGNEVARKEVVIENDIGWRVDTLVDYLFGKPIVINSAAPDPARRTAIEELLRLVIAANGGITFLQQVALIGAVYGFVDVLGKFDVGASSPARINASRGGVICGSRSLGKSPCGPAPVRAASRQTTTPPDDSPSSTEAPGGAAHPATPLPSPAGTAPADDASSDVRSSDLPSSDAPSPTEPATPASSPDAALDSPSIDTVDLADLARRIRLEIVEPARALPFLSPADYRAVDAYAQVFTIDTQQAEPSSRQASWMRRLLPNGDAPRSNTPPGQTRVIELISPTRWQRYEDEKLVAEGENSLGEVPLVHIQNAPLPFRYGGGSEVESLLPLQDELNTRLSDRAHRITMQSFKMYLGRGIEDFTSLPVAPGRMWMTDNPDAAVTEFGGDAACPSEDRHITELREAMDKTSGVTPIAAGAVQGRIGQLTSAAALRVTLQALLAKTERKRTTYGLGIERICELALAWLDRAGLFHTAIDERSIDIHWPSPLPANDGELLAEAATKIRLGVSRDAVLRELGY